MFSAAAHVCSWGAIVFPQLCLSKSLRLFMLPERKPATGHQPDSIKSWLRVDISGNCRGTAGSAMVIRRAEVVQCAVLVRVAGRELRSAPLNALSQIYRLLKATKGRSRVKKGPVKHVALYITVWWDPGTVVRPNDGPQLIRSALNSSKYFLIRPNSIFKKQQSSGRATFWVSDSFRNRTSS